MGRRLEDFAKKHRLDTLDKTASPNEPEVSDEMLENLVHEQVFRKLAAAEYLTQANQDSEE